MAATRDSLNEDSAAGVGYAVAAYVTWGFLPIYMKMLDAVPAPEIVAHRVLWSVPIAAAAVSLAGRRSELLAALRSPRHLGMACVTAALVSLNWGIYVWAITSERAFDAALGYYVNPLFSVFLGFVLLGERLSKLQWIAIALAFVALLLITFEAGAVPLAALGLMLTWGVYGLCKKRLPIGPNQSFLLEVLLLSPIAAGYLYWLGADQHFGATKEITWLLVGCGLATSAPLLLFGNAAKRLRLSTIGILQYIVPTMIFLVALFIFGEPFEGARTIAFPLIWVALVIYSIPMVRAMRAA